MPAVVVGVDRVSEAREVVRERAVAGRVLTHPVRDLHRGAGRALGRVHVVVDPDAVVVGEGRHAPILLYAQIGRDLFSKPKLLG